MSDDERSSVSSEGSGRQIYSATSMVRAGPHAEQPAGKGPHSPGGDGRRVVAVHSSADRLPTVFDSIAKLSTEQKGETDRFEIGRAHV
jgi:hypothetical protein